MAIETRRQRQYVVECDDCGMQSVWCATKDEAWHVAHEEEDYVTTTRWNGLAHVTLTLCSDCQEEGP